MIKRILGKFLKFPIQSFWRYKAKSALTQLTSHESSQVRAVGHALSEALTNTASDQEKKCISLIEQRRSSLLSSDEEIPIIDYGAGTPNSNRTEEEMKAGVQSSARVSSICASSKTAFWAMILFKLIRKLEPSSCVELGSCVGISAAYQACALSINQKGKLVTLEGSPEIAKIAKQTLEGLGLNNVSVVTGPFSESLKEVLENAKPLDFFFNDGHHDHDAVIKYFKDSLPYLSDDAVIVVDDISWSPGMRKAWAEIEDDKRVTISVDLREVGIGFISKNMATKEKFRIPLF